VFAVPKRQVDIYKTLATFIDGSTVGVLTDTSGNVVDLIRSNYEVPHPDFRLFDAEFFTFVIFGSRMTTNVFVVVVGVLVVIGF